MKQRDLCNLLTRAAAGLETPADLDSQDRKSLVTDLVQAAEETNQRLPLFFVRADHPGTGDSLDLLVRAKDQDDAKTLWRENYGLDDEEIEWAGEVPETTGRGAISWDVIHPDEDQLQEQT